MSESQSLQRYEHFKATDRIAFDFICTSFICHLSRLYHHVITLHM